MKPLTLLASEEDFRYRWLKGNGTVVYDARSKIVHVFADVSEGENIGGFAYNAPWSETAFTVAIDKPRIGEYVHLIALVNGERIDLIDATRKTGTFNFRIALDGNDVGIFVDGKLAGKATVKSADKLRFTFESRSIEGGTLHFSNVKIHAVPEPNPPPALPDQKNPAGMKPFTLLQTDDDLAKHFKRGQGTAEFDPKTKTIRFEKTEGWDIGTILYQASWEEVQFDIAIDRQSTRLAESRFLVSFGSGGFLNESGESFDLSSRITGPGQYRIRAAYVKNKTLAVFVNDKPIAPVATILKDSEITPMKLRIFATYKGTFLLRNVKIKALPEK
jgi:hypothetical protein